MGFPGTYNISPTGAAIKKASSKKTKPDGTPADYQAPGLTSGTEPLYGWAGQQGYVPSTLAQVVYQNPFTILPDVFKNLGMSGAGYQSLRDIGADPLTLYNIMAGARTTPAGETGLTDYTNWLKNMYQSFGTRGGRAFSAKELLGNIFRQTRGMAEGGKNATGLAQILASAGAGEQARTLFQLIRDATNVGMNPYAATGYQAAVQRAGDAYQNAMLRQNVNEGANNQLITEFIAKNFPGLLPR